MAIEAKMGMCIVVILISAFGFLVYRKFDARQRSLLQANLQAAEQALPGSTGTGADDPYAEFQSKDEFLTSDAAADAQSAFANSSPNAVSAENDMTASFGSSFALQDSVKTSPVQDLPEQPAGEEALADNSFDQSPFQGLNEPAFTAGNESAQLPDDSTAVAFAGEPAGSQLAGQISSPMDDYLADRQSRESASSSSDSATDSSQSDSPFAAFGDSERPTMNDSPTEHMPTETTGADDSPFGQFGENVTSNSDADESDNAPTFEGFPSGFETETTTSVVDTEATKDQQNSASWAEFGEKQPAEQDARFDTLPATEVASGGDDDQAGEWAPVKEKPQSSPPAFAEFDSLETDSSETQSKATNEPALADSESLFRKRDVSTDAAGSLQPANDDQEMSAFESFGSNDEVELITSDSTSIQVQQPIVEQEKGSDTGSPPGFDDTFASSPVDQKALSPTPDSFDGINQEFTSRRRPLVDPSAVMEPLSGSDTARLISKTERTLNDTSALAVPKAASTAPELSESFDSFANSDPIPADGAMHRTESLRLPTVPGLDEQIAAKSHSGKIQQVSATRDPDGIYTVKDDDTYWTISKHAYGTARFFSSLALYNKNRIKDPRRLRKGMKVVIPDPQVLIEKYPELLQDYIPRESKPTGYFLKANGMPAYRIGERETLSEISQKHLGRASRWIQIYRMNQNVLQNPNRLKPGTVINLPDDATNVHVVP